jgi:hypothetical protein
MRYPCRRLIALACDSLNLNFLADRLVGLHPTKELGGLGNLLGGGLVLGLDLLPGEQDELALAGTPSASGCPAAETPCSCSCVSSHKRC